MIKGRSATVIFDEVTAFNDAQYRDLAQRIIEDGEARKRMIEAPGIDIATFNEWLKTFMSVPQRPEDKMIPMKCCSVIESRAVLCYFRVPENPTVVASQESFTVMMGWRVGDQ